MHPNQRMLFMVGFPRAGSTLLANILAQNPKLYPTPTSGLIGTYVGVKDNWRLNDIYKSSGEEYIYPKIRTTLKNMLLGHYEAQILAGQTPIDKNRTWTNHIDSLDEIFGCKVQFLFPIRHIGDCIISMEKINRKSTLNNHGDNGNRLNEQTTLGRVENFIKPDGVFGAPLVFLRELLYRGEHGRLVLVPYNDMLTYPRETFERVYKQLGMEHFEHDFENIKQTIHEQDMHHGFAPNSLHTIREGKLEKPISRDMKVIHADFIKKIEMERFGDITDFINNNSIVKEIV